MKDTTQIGLPPKNSITYGKITIVNLNKNIYKAAYGQDFKKCLLGQITVQEHLSNLKNKPDFNDIKFILTKEYLPKSYPLLEENFNYIKALKDKGYKLFLLTNITEDSYNYINETININSIFTGGIYLIKNI